MEQITLPTSALHQEHSSFDLHVERRNIWRGPVELAFGSEPVSPLTEHHSH